MISPNRTVLVIDDEEGVRRSLRLILEDRFVVVACSDGAAAIQFATDNPGIVYAAFVDFAMPGMDGNQVCSGLRSLDATISLVGFSGNEDAAFTGPLFANFLKRHVTPESVLALAAKAVRFAEDARRT